MGNFPSQQSTTDQNKLKKRFLDRVEKVSQCCLQQFRNFDIYQLQQKPYDYYIQYVQTTISNNQMLTQKLNFYKNLPKSRNLVPVQYAEIIKRKQMCATFDGLRIFCPFYNFTLEDAIKLKIKQKSTFSQAQAVYILKSLLQIGKFYQNQLKSNFYCGIYKTKNIFISPQGHIKIYPFNENIFFAYAQKQQSLQSSFQLSNLDSKKQSIDFEDKMKPFYQTRDESGVFKSGVNKAQSGLRKSKITTTLKNKNFDSTKSQQLLQLKGLNSGQMSSRPSNSILSSQQSSQTFSYLFKKLSQNQSYNKRDFFQLGLLMMQVFLLNQKNEYYKEKQSKSAESTTGKASKPANSSTERFKSKQQNNRQLAPSLRKYEQYENQSGKVPNVDFIFFSVSKLLPKKNISQLLTNIIQKMIVGSQLDRFQFDQVYEAIEKYQQSSVNPRYCLKFQIQKQDANDTHVSNYMIKNKKKDVFNQTNQGSLAFGQSRVNKKQDSTRAFKPNQSKQMFSYQKLQNLLSYNNLAKSAVVQEESPDTNQVLHNLKNSRKLIPSKIRSISMKSQQINK